ncbi:MAG: XRE family transcriptional regulator [Waterburya sp.]|jgi:transcriptional regulator with XRE-family HTH domain
MSTSLSDKIKSLSPERQEKIAQLTKELIAEEITLQELRKQRQLTQEDMAKLLGIKQENVSRLERRNNLHLSTLKDYIHALGGKLHLVIEFPDQKPIRLLDNDEDE